MSGEHKTHPLAVEVERLGFDENMDWAETMRSRRTLLEYFFTDFPLGLLRFSYFRSKPI